MSRFVAGGTIDEPVERDEEWLKAQQELEANRRKKEDESRQQEGKSLYDILQANKAAKQEAFEESAKLKNQFRSLDNDEVDFLDQVMESTRAQEAAIRKQTTEELDAFRRQREQAEKAARAEESRTDDIQQDVQWHAGPRKKRKVVEKEPVKGVKLRRVSSASGEKDPNTPDAVATNASKDLEHRPSAVKVSKSHIAATHTLLVKPELPGTPVPPVASPIAGLGLAAYSSDDD